MQSCISALPITFPVIRVEPIAMSNVSTVHDVVPFVAGKTAALTGQRLAKVGYKSTAKNPARYASIAVSVPYINPDDITENLQALLPYSGS